MDVKCVVCGEPWDYYGVRHGDMLAWEAKLFRAGAGCPHCQGNTPAGGWEPTTIDDVEYGDEDPIERIHQYEDRLAGKGPKWIRPEPTVLWTCDGCGVEVRTDPDLEPSHDEYLEYHLPADATARQWYHSHPFHAGAPSEQPYHVFTGGQKVCEFCHQHCNDCGRDVCDTIEFGDPYVDGASFPDEDTWRDALCVDCLLLRSWDEDEDEDEDEDSRCG